MRVVTLNKPMARDYKKLNVVYSYREYEDGLGDVSVVKSLREHLSFWQNIGASPYIIDIIKNGFKIPFTRLPKSQRLPNNATARNSQDFVQSGFRFGDQVERNLRNFDSLIRSTRGTAPREGPNTRERKINDRPYPSGPQPPHSRKIRGCQW